MKIALTQISKRDIHPQIAMTGSILNVLTAAIKEENTLKRTPRATGYSLGLGAFGESYPAVENTMGELCTTPDMVGTLTAGEENIPETAAGKDVACWTPFNVSIGHDFAEVYSLKSAEPVSIGDIYSALFDKAKTHPDYRGLLAVSMIFRIWDFYGSLVKRTPLQGQLEGKKITDPGQFEKWFTIDKTPVYRGHLALSVGVGLEPEANLFTDDEIGRIFYLHPGNVAGSARMLHNHCLILPPGDMPAGTDNYCEMVKGLLAGRPVIDVKHILDSTTVTGGYLAVNRIQKIEDLP